LDSRGFGRAARRHRSGDAPLPRRAPGKDPIFSTADSGGSLSPHHRLLEPGVADGFST